MKLGGPETGSPLKTPRAAEPQIPSWPSWTEPQRQYQDCVFDDPSTARPDSTLHLSPSPSLREHGETRLVSIPTVESARARGVDLTVIHAAENGGEGDVARAEKLLAENAIPLCGLAADDNMDAEDIAPLWRCLMKALVESRVEDAEHCWRALRGNMQCVLNQGYEQGWHSQWETEDLPAGPTSPTKFVLQRQQSDITTLDVTQMEPHLEEKSHLIFSPDCRFVAEYGNSLSGGGASFTFDEYKVMVYDTTTGICVYTLSRRETQGMCFPYRQVGGSIESVVWRGPHKLKVTWTDGESQEEDMKINVSSFHFSRETWNQQK